MKIEITLTKSLIGSKPNQRATAKALGLNKINQVVIKEKTPSICGMINTISHLIVWKEIA